MGNPSSKTSVLVVMGVSGSGKTTIAALLSGHLRWELVDGDDFHPPTNVAKMHQGTPLTDDDRRPWLESIAAWIDATLTTGGHGVVACSALRRSYRDVLAGGRPGVRVVYLQGDRALIGQRQAARRNHFMPASLIDSQFETLEEPTEKEGAIIASVVPGPADVTAGILSKLDPA